MTHAHIRQSAIALALLLAVSVLSLAEPTLQQPSPREETHWDRIQDAIDTGRMDAEQGLVYAALALFEPESLPANLRGTTGKCGTPVLVEIEARWPSLSPWARARLSAWPVAAGQRHLTLAESRPTLSGTEQTLFTTHFMIHYTLVGIDAVPPIDNNENGIPDYIDAVAHAIEKSHQTETGELLGWLEPPSDVIIDPANPSYDVYVQNLPVQGLTFPETLTADNEHSPGIVETHARCSYISLHNRLSTDILRVTAAHEYNHAIQFGYNAAAEGFDTRRWLMEGTATWIEDQVYGEVDDNIGYLPRIFAAPDHSLAHPDNFYASWLFFEYIAEHKGGNPTIRGAWERSVHAIGDFSVPVIEQSLEAAGAQFRDTFGSFCAANLLLVPCELAPGPLCYDAALTYLQQAGHPFVEGSVSLSLGESAYLPPDGVQPLSCDYVSISAPGLALAASGYAGDGSADLEGQWLIRDGFAVETISFPIDTDPSPPALPRPHGNADAIHVVVANSTNPENTELAGTTYALMFTAVETPEPSHTVTASPTPGSTPTHTPARRVWLPLILHE